MSKLGVRFSLLSVFLVGVVACTGGEQDGGKSDDGSSAPGVATEGEPGGDTTAGASGAAAHPSLESACDSQFSAMRDRRDRCPDLFPWQNVPALKLATDESDRSSFVAFCVARGKRAGSGYDAAFLKSCAQAMKAAPCGDNTDIVVACWEPKGELARGARCATDDQCADGYCRLPKGASEGSSCGACDTPIWDGEPCGAQGTKCPAGEVCWGYYAGCVPLRSLERSSSCNYSDGSSRSFSCGPARFCTPDGSCAPMTVAKIGQSCADYESTTCEDGADCENGTCRSGAKLGESCDDRPCRDWLRCDAATGTCRPIEGLECK
ncbi:MAG: hypothetical protein KF795_26475 [Labilithrix sp.]|nr:hypothetical protein [Labilithrix sp.]